VLVPNLIGGVKWRSMMNGTPGLDWLVMYFVKILRLNKRIMSLFLQNNPRLPADIKFHDSTLDQNALPSDTSLTIYTDGSLIALHDSNDSLSSFLWSIHSGN